MPSVSEVDSALLLIPDDQPQKLKIIRDFAELVAPIRIGRPTPVDVGQLASEIATLKRRLDIAAAEAPPGDAKTKLTRTTAELAQLIRKLQRMEPEVSEPILNNVQRQVYRDFLEKFQRLQANLSPGPIGLADVPPEIKRKFIGDRGHFLLQIHPAVDIWERDGARRFVHDLRQVDPEVTGTLGTASSLVAALVVLPVLLQILRPGLTSAHAPDAGVRVSAGAGAGAT